MIKPIYLDTNLWNRLFEQEADALRLLDDLKARNANLALSGQTVCELSRTFQSYPQKAQQLFQYMKLYIDAGIIGAHSNMEQLFREIDAMHARASVAVAYYSPAEYDALLFSNWRCANTDSVPRDLVDDMYHVLNASYCSIYATADANQMKYASLLPSGHDEGCVLRRSESD